MIHFHYKTIEKKVIANFLNISQQMNLESNISVNPKKTKRSQK